MNLALCQGLLEGLGDDPGRAVLDPRPDECCVSLDVLEPEGPDEDLP
ncbi:hypothetical protein [Nonomuraea salmonea]